jgi:hypothetical protein
MIVRAVLSSLLLLASSRGWTITPSHYINQQLDTVWLAH